VLAVFTKQVGATTLVLVCEREEPRGAWQFPQGGIEAGEDPAAALAREMREEIGCTAFAVERRLAERVRYRYPADVAAAKQSPKRGFAGQEQVWFRARFAAAAGPDLAAATDREFVAFEWVTPAEALRRAVPFKKDAYRAGLSGLGFDLEGT
jgi:putative (di)nucleoside polyphosphate hydrolase